MFLWSYDLRSTRIQWSLISYLWERWRQVCGSQAILRKKSGGGVWCGIFWFGPYFLEDVKKPWRFTPENDVSKFGISKLPRAKISGEPCSTSGVYVKYGNADFSGWLKKRESFLSEWPNKFACFCIFLQNRLWGKRRYKWNILPLKGAERFCSAKTLYQKGQL